MNKNKPNVLLSTAYFGPVQYYSKLVSAGNVALEKFENYQKQTYRNRCVIYNANGPQTLTVPVSRGDQLKIYTKDVRIDYSGNWQKIHFKAIESAYRCSPFYEYYIDDLAPLFEKKYERLYDLNLDALQITCDLLEITAELYETDEYEADPPEGYRDFRELIHPKPRMFKPDPEFNPPVYTQVFEPKHGFVANLSILDLLFNTGNEALNLLQESIVY